VGPSTPVLELHGLHVLDLRAHLRQLLLHFLHVVILLGVLPAQACLNVLVQALALF